ncbi:MULTISPECIES: Bug family tripartite tricarboxylate transporter substrate binding protein [Cupriavidus]
MKYKRLGVLIAATTLGAAVWSQAAIASGAYPDKPVRLIIPFAPAGTTDVLGRILAKKLTEASGQPFVVDNRPGAGGNIGMDAVAKADPDGYTLGMIITSHAINVSMPPKPSYDVLKDLSMVSVLTLSNNVLVVGPNVPAHSVKELLALGRSGALQLSYASSGKGTTPHLSGELLGQMSGVKMTHIPYRGAGPAMVDVMAGVVPMMFDAITTGEPQIRSGKVRALAVTGKARSPLLKDVPTMEEAGLPGYVVDGWLGLAAPARMPAERMKWLSEQVNRIMASPEMKEWVEKQGMIVANYSPEKSAKFLSDQVSQWARVVAKSEVQK